ncbi:MAG: bifunctional DNA-formamidopyrimidine glycosylase/DNA-(apurinic or apyrimidinic site) lyase [Minisyncoccia bacterium]
MPELPETQIVVNELNKSIKNYKIKDFWMNWKYFNEINQFKKNIINKTIKNIQRKGKNILFYLSNDYILLIHQRISGHLLIGKWIIKNNKPIPIKNKKIINDIKNQFIHFILILNKNKMIGLSDQRKLAKIKFGPIKKILNLPEIKNLGIDPLDKNFTLNNLKLILNSSKTIKTLLMDYHYISGIGNIYSDEILWKAKIHPLTKSNKLNDIDIKNLYQSIKFILKRALKLGGSSINNYRNAYGNKGLYINYGYVYQKANKKCKRCNNLIKKIKINSRSSYFCPKCQIIK